MEIGEERGYGMNKGREKEAGLGSSVEFCLFWDFLLSFLFGSQSCDS